jgi:signal transduction histidine kinase
VTIPHQLLDPAFAAAWDIQEAIATSISCDALDGWLIIPKRATEDDLYLARALSVQLSAALGNAAAAETWRDAAASEEGVRVAHDLHDGILQFLTGLALQLRLMERQIKSDPDGVTARNHTMAAALRHEQQDLRGILERIRPRQPAAAERGRPMSSWIPMLAEQWDISIDADISAEPPASLADEIRLITREAIANAVRHGAARHVAIRSEQASGFYHLAIADNGSGFDMEGQFTAAGLRDNNIGPRSILQRLDRMDGQLILDTSPKGTRLDMRFSSHEESQP